MNKEALKYLISLGLIPGIGPVKARNIIAHYGNVEEVFENTKELIDLLPKPYKGNGGKFITEALKRAEQEIEWADKENVQILHYGSEKYPFRLKQINDHPLVLYYRGSASLNSKRIIGIVGTRRATDYGKTLVREIIEEIAPYQPLIISGLAYGIDICAHQLALENGLETIAVLGHGLHTIYPSVHRATAQKMEKKGGLLTEFLSGSKFEKENFPKRNRIVAGLLDALIVIETQKKGGSMITADLAFQYNREVFAVPGNFDRKNSAGCNHLIKIQKAQLLDSPKSLATDLSWPELSENNPGLQELPLDLREDEQHILQILNQSPLLGIDDLTVQSKMQSSKLAELLLELEFKGLVKQLPGKRFKRC